MKFTWFNLMPWPYLPDDFRQKHRSVWVDIPSSLYVPVKGHALYNAYLDELEYADHERFWIHPIDQAARAGVPAAAGI